MRKLTLTLSAAALALGGATVAYADHHKDGKRGPDANGDGVVTLAEATAGADEMFTRMDANGDGVLNAEDRAARKGERFAKLDANGDGEVTQAEMDSARAERKAKRFARLDTDGSGGISQDEMDAAREKMGERRSKRGDRAEGRERGERRGERGKMRGPGGRGGLAMLMLRMADKDGDKSVTRAEFDAAVKTHFAQVDSNKDGKITADEREAAHKAMRDKMKERRSAKAEG